MTPLLNNSHRKTFQNALTNMIPERVPTLTIATNESMQTDQGFTLSELEDSATVIE